MVRQAMFNKLFSVFTYSCVLLLLYASALQAQKCPLPWAYSVPYGGALLEGQYRYAYPGQLLSATMIVVNGVSPCSTVGEEWYNSNWIRFLDDGGYGWQEWIHQGASDCRTQHWTIPIPFDNPDESYISATYWHAKAIFHIYVIDYPDPDPCKTTDMDPVNTYTGAFNGADEDYANSDLVFARNYDPIALAGIYKADPAQRWKNPVGYGWQHNYNIYVEEIQQINVSPPDTIYGCLFHEGKETSLYKLLANGEYQPRRGNHSNLKKSGGIFKIYKSNGEVYYFGSTGKIDSIVDRNGRKTSFSYSGSYLSQVTGKDNHTLSFEYDSDSLLRWLSITENNETKKFEYRYAPVTYVFNGETPDTFDLLGVYYLAQTLQHYPTGSADSVISLYKYYYDNLRMVAKVFPQDSYTQSDTLWEGNYKKGDRLYVWYNTSGFATYQEVIDGDGDTLLTNDQVAYRAYTEYFRSPESNRSMDSTLTYIYQQEAGTGSAHDPYDTTFTPQAPSSNYAVRKRDYHAADFGREIFIEMRPDFDSSFVTKIYKGKDFNDTLFISPDNDTTRYSYKTYVLNDTTKYSPNPKKIVYPSGDSILYYYHAPDANAPSFFLLDSTIDELSRKTARFYDNNYNLDSLRYVSRYVAGLDTTNITTDYTHNSIGNLTQLKDPLGNSTYFSYAPNDTGPYVTKTRIDFSPSGQGNEDIITKHKYDTDIGKIDTTVYFQDYPDDSSIVRYTYDVMNRLKEIHYPDGTRDVLTYDKRGNLLKKETFENTNKHSLIAYEYDARDRLAKVKEYTEWEETEAYDSTLYKYNLNDDLISFVNANDTIGISTEIKYKYDVGRLIKVDYPDTTNDSLGFYKDGNLKFKRDRRGKVIAYVYDKRDRLTKKRYFNSFAAYEGFPDSVPGETLAFVYDKVGNMISMVDKNGTISYSYDEMGGLDTLNCYQDILMAYEYDKGGNTKKLKVVKVSDTSTVFLEQTYPSYDEANRLKNTVVDTDTFNFTYWDTEPIKEINYPNGLRERYWLTSRNFTDSMLTIDPGPPQTKIYEFDYKYNEVGDRDTLDFYLSRPATAALSGTIAYGYDKLWRITQASYPRSIYAKTNKYNYDKTGNRLRKTAATDTIDYGYNKRNNQLLTEGKESFYYYDDCGNMAKYSYEEGEDTLVYDFENRLTQFVKNRTDLPTPTFDTLWYNYCGLGKRISKIEKPHGQNPDSTSYAYDGIYAVCEFGGHLDLKAKYVYANGMLLARYDESSADTHYYHHDGLGSTVGMTDENKSVEQSYFYDEFGNSLGSWGSASNNYLYTAQEYDGSVTQLYNLRARYYKPSIGRFISEDPVCPGMAEFPLGINPYIYVLDNPTNAIDPSGQMPMWKCKTTIHRPIFEREPRQRLTHHGQWRFAEPLGAKIISANWLYLFGAIACYFERENVRTIKGRVWKIVPYTIVCVDECGELPPYTQHGEEKKYVGRYAEVKKWTSYCNFTIPGEYYGAWAEKVCIDNLWRCDR